MPLLEVKIPSMGESINSGVLATWHVADGAVVKKDQPLYELETDKITSEGTAEAAGKVSFKVEAGTEVKIGQVVATIDTDAKAESASGTAAAGGAPSSRPAPGGAGSTPPTPSGIPSPAVRRIAEETGIDPAKVAGSGKGGRVTKGDMLGANSSASSAPSVPPSPIPAPPPLRQGSAGQAGAGYTGAIPSKASGAAPTPSANGRQTRRKMSPLRRRIAERLVSAQHEAAMLTTFNEVDMSAVMALRAQHQEAFVKKNGVKLGFMSFFTKAVVHALREVPAVNTQLDGPNIVDNHYYDIGVAVSTDKGLMVPVIKDCEKLGMAEIEKAIAGAAVKAREGKIAIADLEGGVFTITNGGTFGSMLSTPIINPPQSAILGLHTIKERPVAIDGQVFVRPIMYLALSYDHRLVDGKEAVTFLVKVKEVIENPSLLPLGL